MAKKTAKASGRQAKGKAAARGKMEAHYISGTHWDREWYRPVQEYRLLLVEVMDELLDIFRENPDFRYFHLDGQTCVLNDFTEVRPEKTDELAALMKDGRVLVGPWYTMPDLFCPGDEALVRNLLMGRRICGEWGVEPMPVAYTCDMFGHPSQMPQIYAGFDLPYCVLGRGANEHTTPAYFRWRAPDGTEVFAFKRQDQRGYGAFNGPRNVIESAGPDADTAEVEGRAREAIERYVDHERGRANGDVLCLMDALDHVSPAADIARYIRLVEEACPGVTVQHSTLPAFFAAAEKNAKQPPVKTGELREPAKSRCGYLWLIPNCVSARVRMKQANDACQNLLEKETEPFLAFANLAGAGLPERFLRLAWEQVLLNHAHDSICGCSIDQVHRDMMYRFDQARIIGEQVRNKALGALTFGCADPAADAGEEAFGLVLANPAPQARDETLVFDIDLPQDYAHDFALGFNTQRVKAFRLYDLDGNEVPYQRLALDPQYGWRSDVAQPCFLTDGPCQRYTVAARVPLPALGFTSLVVKPSATAVHVMGSLRTGPTAAENEHLALCIDPNGTLSVTDKATGQTYTDLLTFEDRSEEGDGWFHGESVNDEIALSAASTAQVAVVQDGPELVRFRIAVTLDLPARYDWRRQRRSDERVAQTVVSLVTLRRGARAVDVETTMDNRVEDHRLRVLFPTDAADATTWLAHHPYDVVERPIALDTETADWNEHDLAEKPFLHLQAVGDDDRGLAFLSAGGLHEGGVVDDARRTMQVTLLRSFRKTVGTSGEHDGLEQGRITWRYALLPYAGAFPAREAFGALQALQTAVAVRQTGRFSSGHPPMNGTDRPEKSFLAQKTGALVVSAVKPREAGGGLVVRLWNPTGRQQKETLTFDRKVQGAAYCKLNETPAGGAKPAAKGKTVTVEAPAHGIVTVEVDLGPAAPWLGRLRRSGATAGHAT